jgi:catechol 2,3-dioxygenase-like lactoylglutathione lyase family enzyme
MTIPVLRVSDYDAASAFYAGWLGFKIDQEQRPDDGPFLLRLTLKDYTLQLIQSPPGAAGSWVILAGFKNLVAYRKLMSMKDVPYAKPVLRQAPGEANTLSMTLMDPFGNRLEFRERMR